MTGVVIKVKSVFIRVRYSGVCIVFSIFLRVADIHKENSYHHQMNAS